MANTTPPLVPNVTESSSDNENEISTVDLSNGKEMRGKERRG
jgi:hypothetical protein